MNYKESTVSGQAWQRAKVIQIWNEYGQAPRVEFIEEKVISLGDNEVIKQPTGSVGKTIEDFTETIQIINPETGADTGTTMTIEQVYAAIFSLYLKLAQNRDNQPTQGGLP
jgi:hypothetical protein